MEMFSFQPNYHLRSNAVYIDKTKRLNSIFHHRRINNNETVDNLYTVMKKPMKGMLMVWGQIETEAIGKDI